MCLAQSVHQYIGIDKRWKQNHDVHENALIPQARHVARNIDSLSKMRSSLTLGFILTTLVSGASSAQPVPIEGIAHVGFRTGDLEKARSYYTGLLGFQQAFELKAKDGGIASAFFKV